MNTVQIIIHVRDGPRFRQIMGRPVEVKDGHQLSAERESWEDAHAQIKQTELIAGAHHD